MSEYLVLQSNDTFDEIAYLDPTTGELIWKEKPPEFSLAQIQGVASRALDGRTICFYRRDNHLCLRIDGEEYCFDGRLELKLEHLSRKQNRVSILEQGRPIFIWEYRRPVDPVELQRDPTPFIEEEHFDILLFAYNVLRNPRRRREIYRVGD